MGWNRIFILLLIFVNGDLFSQSHRYFISFTDKNNSPFSLSQPQFFLSQKSIDRRNIQGIPLNSTDLPVNPAYLDSIRSVPNVQIVHFTKWLNGVTIETADTLSLAAIQNFTFVSTIQRNRSREIGPGKDLIPLAEREYWSEMEVDPWYGVAFNQIRMLNGHRLHDLGFDGRGKTIAVLDAGFPAVYIMSAFRTMREEGRIVGAYDFVDMEGDIYDDFHFHGTTVLSCMGTYLPGQYIGTSPGASFWLLITENDDSEYIVEEDNWVVAAEYADSVGADIINSSLGYTQFDDSTQDHTYQDMDGNTTRISIAADLAAAKGMLVVNSAGNSGGSSWFYLSAPADGDSVLAVGAVDKDRNYAYFSSKGPSSDGDVKPNVSAQGYGPFLVWPDEGISQGNGTSFSSPIIAGMAACLWQAHPEKTNMEIFRAIEQSADRYSQPDSLTGHGIPDFLKAHQILSGAEVNSDSRNIILDVYPNPFQDNLTIDLFSVDDQEVELELLDISSRSILARQLSLSGYTNSRITINEPFAQLPTGVYLLKINWSSGTIVRKLIKH